MQFSLSFLCIPIFTRLLLASHLVPTSPVSMLVADGIGLLRSKLVATLSSRDDWIACGEVVAMSLPNPYDQSDLNY